MAIVVLLDPMNTDQFLLGSPSEVTQVSGGGNNATVTFGSELELVFSGQGLSLDGLVPVSGRVTRVDAYRTVNGLTTQIGWLEVTDPDGWLFSRAGLLAGYAAEPHRIGGSAGFDVIAGGEGNDVIIPRGAEDWITAGAGDDTVWLEAFFGGGAAPPMELDGGAGSDLLDIFGISGAIDLRPVRFTGFEAIRAADGATVTMTTRQMLDIGGLGFGGINIDWRLIQTGARADLRPITFETFDLAQFIVIGRAGDDVQIGHGAINSILQGRGGRDVLTGGAGFDQLSGGTGADRLSGGDGVDLLTGDGGNDRLNGGAGDDALAGGTGADLFVFSDAPGNDRIDDFRAFGAGQDRIDLRAIATVTGWQDLARNHLREDDGDVVIELGNGNSITLTGVAMPDLDAADFLF